MYDHRQATPPGRDPARVRCRSSAPAAGAPRQRHCTARGFPSVAMQPRASAKTRGCFIAFGDHARSALNLRSSCRSASLGRAGWRPRSASAPLRTQSRPAAPADDRFHSAAARRPATARHDRARQRSTGPTVATASARSRARLRARRTPVGGRTSAFPHPPEQIWAMPRRRLGSSMFATILNCDATIAELARLERPRLRHASAGKLAERQTTQPYAMPAWTSLLISTLASAFNGVHASAVADVALCIRCRRGW